MRVIALVSLALALAASSMPLSTRADGGVSTTKEESTGTLGAVGSELGNAVNPPGNGAASAVSLENGSLGSSAASGSGSGGGVYESGSSTTSGLGSGPINPTRRSTTSSTPGDIEGAVSQLGGETASAVGSTTSTSNPIPGDANSDISALDDGAMTVLVLTKNVAKVPGAANKVILKHSGVRSVAGATNTFRLRAVTGNASGAGQAVGGLGEIAGAAAGQANGAGNGAKGIVKNAGAGSLSKSG